MICLSDALAHQIHHALGHRMVPSGEQGRDLFRHRMDHLVTDYMPLVTGWKTQTMIWLADALALPDAFGHRMVHPVTKGLCLADAKTIW